MVQRVHAVDELQVEHPAIRDEQEAHWLVLGSTAIELLAQPVHTFCALQVKQPSMGEEHASQREEVFKKY